MYVNGRTLVRTRFSCPVKSIRLEEVRLALLNDLYAHHYGGSLVLRMNDADVMCMLPELAAKPVLDGLRWLGFTWEEGPVYQSSRHKRYREVAEALIQTGCAYPDFTPSDTATPYRGKNRNMHPDQAYGLYDDTGWCVRYKIPDDEKIVLDDLVLGKVEFNTSQISDPIILRDGWRATQDFIDVVDDADMKITHVLRSHEALKGVAVQLLIHNELGNMPPFFGHLKPLCHGVRVTPDAIAKMRALGFNDDEIRSRTELDPSNLTYYIALGYPPEALADYLAGEKEIRFLNKSAYRRSHFSPDELLYISGSLLKQEDVSTKTKNCLEFVQQAKHDTKRVREIVALCGDKFKVYSDILVYGSYLLGKPVYKFKDVEAYLDPDTRQLLDILVQLFRHMPIWNALLVEQHTNNFLDIRGLKPDKLVAALKVAITGSVICPKLFEVMDFLGKGECLARCQAALEFLCEGVT